jgi:hypothetical protein
MALEATLGTANQLTEALSITAERVWLGRSLPDPVQALTQYAGQPRIIVPSHHRQKGHRTSRSLRQYRRGSSSIVRLADGLADPRSQIKETSHPLTPELSRIAWTACSNIDSARNETRPIYRLPPEILALIIDFCQFAEQYWKPYGWVRLMLVSRTWNATILSFPSLWSKLVLDASISQFAMLVVVDRSGSHPLEVKIPSVPSEAHRKSILYKHIELVVKLLPRVSRLTIDASDRGRRAPSVRYVQRSHRRPTLGTQPRGGPVVRGVHVIRPTLAVIVPVSYGILASSSIREHHAHFFVFQLRRRDLGKGVEKLPEVGGTQHLPGSQTGRAPWGPPENLPTPRSTTDHTELEDRGGLAFRARIYQPPFDKELLRRLSPPDYPVPRMRTPRRHFGFAEPGRYHDGSPEAGRHRKTA